MTIRVTEPTDVIHIPRDELQRVGAAARAFEAETIIRFHAALIEEDAVAVRPADGERWVTVDLVSSYEHVVSIGLE